MLFKNLIFSILCSASGSFFISSHTFAEFANEFHIKTSQMYKAKIGGKATQIANKIKATTITMIVIKNRWVMNYLKYILCLTIYSPFDSTVSVFDFSLSRISSFVVLILYFIVDGNHQILCFSQIVSIISWIISSASNLCLNLFCSKL